MSDVSDKARSVLTGAMSNIFAKVGKATLDIPATERLRAETARITEAISKLARQISLETLKRVDTGLVAAFKEMGDDIEKLEKRVEALENKKSVEDFK